MRLTQLTDYALRVLMYLGAEPARRHTVADIAAAYGVSRHHLHKVVHLLAQHGFIDALRGRGGGLSLAHAPAEISLGAVVRRMEPAALVECLHKDGHCVIHGHCRLAGALLQAFEGFLAVLDGYSLEDITRGNRSELQRLLRIPALELDE
jgi:Rrf2 family nitric oxide-sensitive transcriptional repressor